VISGSKNKSTGHKGGTPACKRKNANARKRAKAVDAWRRPYNKHLKLKMVEAARIAWAAILIKTRQLILFDGAGFGIFVACARRR